ncbi:unnamed protein product [Absidia cylindrospora]
MHLHSLLSVESHTGYYLLAIFYPTHMSLVFIHNLLYSCFMWNNVFAWLCERRSIPWQQRDRIRPKDHHLLRQPTKTTLSYGGIITGVIVVHIFRFALLI